MGIVSLEFGDTVYSFIYYMGLYYDYYHYCSRVVINTFNTDKYSGKAYMSKCKG